MYPGYGNGTYFSPVRLDRVSPLRHRLIELEYLNCGYAEGAQEMNVKYRVHRRGERHIILDEFSRPERTVIIEPLTALWIIAHAPWFVERLPELK
jgi:hypothetical protein